MGSSTPSSCSAAANDFLSPREKQLDGSYYISRVLIPPLERIFNLVGADVRGWYEEMPRRIRVVGVGVEASSASPEKPKAVMTPGRLRIEEHFRNSQCILCRSFSDEGEQHRTIYIYLACITYVARAVRALPCDSCGDHLRTSFTGSYLRKPCTDSAQGVRKVHPVRAIRGREVHFSRLPMAVPTNESRAASRRYRTTAGAHSGVGSWG